MKPHIPSRFTIAHVVEERSDYTALYHTLTDAFVLIPTEAWTGILKKDDTTDSEMTQSLNQQGFLVDPSIDESMVFESWRLQHVYDYRKIQSKVLITRKCNNRCAYCYLDPEPGHMSPETAKAMDQFYFEFIKTHRPESVEDDFLGGEPLVNASVLYDVVVRRSAFCKKEGLSYGFTMTTNGTLLTPEIIDQFKAAGLKGIRVSMAGPAAIHNRLRPSASQGETYHIILERLKAISGIIPISIECQYDCGSDDYLNIPEMMDDLIREKIAIEKVFFSPILSKRGESAFNTGNKHPKKGLYLMQEALNRGFLEAFAPPTNTCVTDFKAKFIFDTNGSIIPCPCFQEGEMAYGDVFQGIDFVKESQLLIRRYPSRCFDECGYLPLCMGGCRFQALVLEDDYNGVDCQIDMFKAYLENYIKAKALACLPDDETA